MKRMGQGCESQVFSWREVFFCFLSIFFHVWIRVYYPCVLVSKFVRRCVGVCDLLDMLSSIPRNFVLIREIGIFHF